MARLCLLLVHLLWQSSTKILHFKGAYACVGCHNASGCHRQHGKCRTFGMDVICCMREKPFPSNVTDKVRRSFRALQLVWIRIVFIKWNLCMRKGLCWSLIHDLSMTPLISRRAQHIGYKTHSLHVHYQDSCVLITISYITHLSCSAVVHTQSSKNTSEKLGLSFSV